MSLVLHFGINIKIRNHMTWCGVNAVFTYEPPSRWPAGVKWYGGGSGGGGGSFHRPFYVVGLRGGVLSFDNDRCSRGPPAWSCDSGCATRIVNWQGLACGLTRVAGTERWRPLQRRPHTRPAVYTIRVFIAVTWAYYFKSTP